MRDPAVMSARAREGREPVAGEKDHAMRLSVGDVMERREESKPSTLARLAPALWRD